MKQQVFLCLLMLLFIAGTKGKENYLQLISNVMSILLLTAQIIPTSFTLISDDVSLINGSSVTRPCSSSGETLNCTDPASSVLFDGHIPTLTGLGGDMWASQLLTLRLMNSSTKVTFNFTDNIDLVRI